MSSAKYALTPEVERLVAYAECSDPRFHESLGHAVEADRLPTEACRHLVAAAQALALANGRPCSSPLYAIQHLKLLVNRGKITAEQLAACSAVLDMVEDAGGVRDVESLVDAAAPAVQHVAHMAAVEQTVKEIGHGVEPGSAAARFEAVAGIGKVRQSMGSALEWGDVGTIAADASSTIRDPLTTGVDELDGLLGGFGIERATLGVCLGGSGDGKSLFLCHVSVAALLEGVSVAYVTLELSESAIRQRVRANLVDMTPREMEADPLKAQQRYNVLLPSRANGIGRFRVMYMTPRTGTISMVKTWLERVEKEEGSRYDLIVVDYADKLTSKVRKGEEGSSYVEQGLVYTQLRNMVVERDGWGWTASQTTGREGRKKKVDLEDVSDSIEKIRVADTVVAISRSDEDVAAGQTKFRVPKRRNGEAHGETPSLAMDAEHGRIVAVHTRRNPPWPR